MNVTKEGARKFRTPSGGALVWGLVSSVTRGIAGWHFVLQEERGLENYFSEDGQTFSSAFVRSENLVIGLVEIDTERVRLLRRLWEEYILRLDILPMDSPEIVVLG